MVPALIYALYQVSNTHNNQLFEYCKKGKVQQLLDALSDFDAIALVDERKNTLLCTALKHGQWQIFTKLLESNCSFNPVKPVLISACQYNKDDVAGINLALQFNSDVDVMNSENRTALMTACLLGHVNKVQELLELGATVTTQDTHGNTALMEAVHSRNKRMVELMLKQRNYSNNANNTNNINHTNNAKESALTLAVKHKTPNEEIVKLLLE
ncbi:MAG: ankyrin repeat domain-containing protein, partial [Proteobacteria bacterium]|nr:ankyrin repeat domain-containing protein [Pseudomonadota bacterium]